MGYKKELAKLGYPQILGANKISEGYNFAVQVPEGVDASLVLYKKKAELPEMELPFSTEQKAGEICSMMLAKFPAEQYEYNFKIDGEVVQDPCAYKIIGKGAFGEAAEEKEHKIRCGFLTEAPFDWENDKPLRIPYSDMILYKIHVRGYTKQAKLSTKQRGTFKGLKEMIPYWKELGINAIELMPAYEFEEAAVQKKNTELVQKKEGNGKINYWGYLPGFYFAPKRAYCATDKPEQELRELVKALHKNGIECIMEMYFPKDISSEIVLRVLQFWKMFYHIDGFHLVGDGISKELILKDGILSGTKIMADWFSDEEVSWQSAQKEKNLAEYNVSFLESMRRFLKSDEDMLGAAAGLIKRNCDRKTFVNFMAYQDGFTMNDMVTYNYKHNEANGEENHDGSSYNFTWNCGVEGPTRKQGIRAARERQLRNAFLMLLLSQGVPMIYGGDEIGNSQEGNNNAYCQDNAIGWIDWRGLKKNESLFQFVKEVIAFRKEHPILHMETALKGIDYKTKGLPDVSVHGERAWYCSYENTSRLLGIMYCGAYAEKADGNADDVIYIGYNFHWENREIALPNLPEKMKWKKVADTSDYDGKAFFKESEETFEKKIEIAPRTIVVLIGKLEA